MGGKLSCWGSGHEAILLLANLRGQIGSILLTLNIL